MRLVKLSFSAVVLVVLLKPLIAMITALRLLLRCFGFQSQHERDLLAFPPDSPLFCPWGETYLEVIPELVKLKTKGSFERVGSAHRWWYWANFGMEMAAGVCSMLPCEVVLVLSVHK